MSTPAVLLAYQQRWVSEPADVAVWEKSRRIGASWCDACDAVMTAAPAENAMDALYIGYSEDMTREYIDDCAMWAKAFDFAAGAMDECVYEDEGLAIKAFRIDFASGKKILALSSRPRSIRGKQGKVTIDEAAFHDDLPGLLKAALAMLIWGGKVRLLSSHNGDANPFNELVNDIRACKVPYALHRTTFDDALADGLYERVKLIRGDRLKEKTQAAWRARIYAQYGDNAAEELDVVPSQSGGAYLTMGLIEARMTVGTPLARGRWTSEFAYLPDWEREAEVAEWCEEHLKPILASLNKDLAHGFGEDFGRTGDLTIIDIMEETRTLDIRVKAQVELSNCPFRQQGQILLYIVSRLPRFRSGVLDARGNGQYLAERAAQKFGQARIEQVMLSDSFYLANMPRFKAALQDGTLADIPKDTEVRDDLRALRVIDGVPKLPKSKTQKEDGPRLQRHGDSAIGLFLGHYAMKRAVAPIEYQGVANKRNAGKGRDDVGGNSDRRSAW